MITQLKSRLHRLRNIPPRKVLLSFVICHLSLVICSCATVRHYSLPIKPKISGVYHRVKKGETLWKISRAYKISIGDIIAINKLSNMDRIDSGQLLFIPYATNTLDIDTDKENGGFIWPLKRKVVAFYGTKKGDIKQKGINIHGKQGENIVAAKSGKVSFCGDYVKGYGKLVIIDHSENFQTIYAHNSQNLVKQGQKVKQGEIIAKVGSSGRVFTPQLHFEVRKGCHPQNPFYYLP